ncbi:glycosyltransferase family 39 protein [Patescibacteria group bacterium]|nr:glycosyltransferase family 39 protein [Patescibacteria group bacterium]
MLKKIWPLFLILLLAFMLRFYKLAEVPHGMAWDEAAIAYNGFAIFNTRRDEWLQRLPITFRSFGDYKAPFAIYESGFFTALFGMNLWAVRLPFAIYGVLAVLAIYLLFRELFYKHENREKWALLAAFILATSPWHIHYSRVAFESGIALSMMIWALYFFYRYLRLEKVANLFLSVLLAVMAIYAYHSSKVTIPLLFLFLLLTNLSFFKKKSKDMIIGGIMSLVLLAPFLWDAFMANGLTRASSTIFSQGYDFFELSKNILTNFLSYFSLDYLIFGKNMGNFRHGDGRFGIIEPVSLALIIIYLFSKKQQKKLFSLSLAIIFFGLFPAVISQGQSSSLRSFLALPGVILLVILAIEQIYNKFKSQKKTFLIILVSFYLLVLGAYQRNYYQNYNQRNNDDFMDGYLETMTYLRNLDRSNIKQIVFTNDYQQAYIYALFVFEVNPIAYQGGILNLFFFTGKVDASDLAKENTIVVASKFDDMGERQADKVIKGSDGQGRFFIYLPL